MVTHKYYKTAVRPHRRKLFRKPITLTLIIVIVALSLFVFKALNKPLLAITPINTMPLNITAVNTTVSWPVGGQAAIGTITEGVVAHSDKSEQPLAMASIAKVVTALMILDKKPLKGDDPGPLHTIIQQDVDTYNYYTTYGGSRTLVTLGEQISERQMLEALLLPSANNIAESLVTWIYGTPENYLAATNLALKQWGLLRTHVADSSGFSNETVSTPSDLVKLGIRALQNPVLARIVNTQQSVIPVAGTITNVNRLLGTNGIIGIKTGNTEDAGGCLLFAATHMVANNQPITIIGAVQGMANLNDAFEKSTALLENAKQKFILHVPLHQADTTAHISTPWGDKTTVIAKSNAEGYGWQSSNMVATVHYNKITPPVVAGSKVGTISYLIGGKLTTVDAITAEAVQGPSLWWKLFHYF